MEQALPKVLSKVALETFEKLAFIFGTYDEDQDSAGVNKNAVAVQVRFSGRFSGMLEIKISDAVLPELAANMLGIDESGPVGVDDQQDALREVANVVCGRLLPLIGGLEAEFSIAQPLIVDLPSTGYKGPLSDPVACARLVLEEGVCDLALAVDGALPERLTPEALEKSELSLEWNTL